MNIRKLFLLATLLTTGAFSICKAQTTQAVGDAINAYAEKYQQERIYMHLDKPAYVVGDTVWFRAYIMAGIEPSAVSKTLYVDFSDAAGRVLAHLAYPTMLSFGQFKIPDSLETASVHIRAYTKWMLNFDSTFLYNKDIKVALPTAKAAKFKAPAIQSEITFFPEGGWLVNGLMGKLAFKANDQFGRPINAKGIIVDSKGTTVASFKAAHDGLGAIPFLPDIAEKYSVRWSGDDDKRLAASLPEIKPEGIGLTIGNAPGKKTFTVKRTATGDNLKSLNIVATLYQQVVYMAKLNLGEKTSVSSSIPMQDLPAGVLTITVLDDKWSPLAERITYSGNTTTSIYTPEVGFTKIAVRRKAENEIAIHVPDSITTSMSVSIIDNSLEQDSSDNIISQLLLSGDLKGSVYHPRYYFSDSSEEVRNNLDLVMLTHGWRRFNWANVVNGIFPPIKYPADTTFLTLNGKIFGASAEQLRAAGSLFIIAKPKDTTGGTGKNVQSLILPIRPDGTFGDSSAIFFDSLSVYYQFAQKKNLTDRVSVTFMPDRLAAPKSIISSLNASDYNFVDTAGNYRNRMFADQLFAEIARRKAGELAAVTVRGRQKSLLEQMDDKYASGLFKSGDGYAFDIVNDPSAQGMMNVFQYLQGRVAGLQISNAMDASPTLSWRGGNPALFLDEVPQMDAQMLSTMSMADVAYIKVIRPPFIGAAGGGSGGAIAVYTRRGNDVVRTESSKSSLSSNIIAGYSAQREFYSPNYATFSADMDAQDLRTTLYWNPIITTNPQYPTFKVRFFNNDLTKSFRLVVEGMDNAGRLIHVEKVVE